MRLTHYEPWGFLNQLYRDLDQIYTRGNAQGDEDTMVATSSWIPAVDIKEDEQRFFD